MSTTLPIIVTAPDASPIRRLGPIKKKTPTKKSPTRMRSPPKKRKSPAKKKSPKKSPAKRKNSKKRKSPSKKRSPAKRKTSSKKKSKTRSKSPKKRKSPSKKKSKSPKKRSKTRSKTKSRSKSSKTRSHTPSRLRPGSKLGVRQQKYCRCVLHVASNQSDQCNRGKKWVGGKSSKCVNPYAVCARSTGGSSRECGSNYSFASLNLKELKAYAQLNRIKTANTRATLLKNIKEWKEKKYGK